MTFKASSNPNHSLILQRSFKTLHWAPDCLPQWLDELKVQVKHSEAQDALAGVDSMIYLTLRTQKPTAFKPPCFLPLTSLLQLFLVQSQSFGLEILPSWPVTLPLAQKVFGFVSPGAWRMLHRFMLKQFCETSSKLPSSIHIFPPSDSTNCFSADFYCSLRALMVETKLCACTANWRLCKLWFIAVFCILLSCPQTQILSVRTPYIRLNIGIWALWWNFG